MTIITKEIKMSTAERLDGCKQFSDSFDGQVNRLLDIKDEVDKYIVGYVKKQDGKCINETIIGMHVIANHSFELVDGKHVCRCGAESPIVPSTDCENTTIEIL